MSDQRLKIMALDNEDLQIIAAHCQDAVVKVSDIQFIGKEKRLVLQTNRFVWENKQARTSVPERRRSVLHFGQVEKVSSIGFDLSNKETILNLLTIKFEETNAPAGSIDLLFSGDITIRMDVECVEAQLADMQAAWAASSMPKHPKD